MKQKDILFIVISALFVIVAWIIFEIYHNSVTSTLSKELISQVTPIKADFDPKIIEAIKNRQKIEPLYESSSSAVIVLTPTPTPIASPTPTIIPLEILEIEEGSEASPEGELLP